MRPQGEFNSGQRCGTGTLHLHESGISYDCAFKDGHPHPAPARLILQCPNVAKGDKGDKGKKAPAPPTFVVGTPCAPDFPVTVQVQVRIRGSGCEGSSEGLRREGWGVKG